MAQPNKYLDEIEQGVNELRASHGADVEGNTVYRVGRSVARAADAIDPVKLEAERQKRELLNETAQQNVRHSVKASRGELKKLRRAMNRVSVATEGAKDLDPSYKTEIEEGLAKTREALSGEAPQNDVVRYLKYAGKHIAGPALGLLDAPDRQLRHLTTPGRPADLTSWTGDKSSDVTSEEWNERIRERMGKLERPGDIASNVVGYAGKAIGDVLGSPLAAIPVTLGVAADLAEGKGLQGLTRENLEKTREDTARDVGDFARTALVSPLNVVGGFKSGGLKVAEQLVNLGKKAGIADDVLRAAAKSYLAEYAASPGPRESLDAGIKYAEKILGPKGARAAFGEQFEFLGKEGLKFGVGKASVELPVQKGVKKIAEKLGTPGAADLFSPQKEIAKVTAKRSKVFRSAAEKRGTEEWTPLVALAAKSGVSPARLDELIKKGATPGTLVLGTPKTQAEKQIIAEARDIVSRQQLMLKAAGGTAPTGPVAVPHIGAPKSWKTTERGFDQALIGNAKEQARMLAQKQLEREISTQFGGAVPKFAQDLLNSTHDDAFASMSRAIARFGGESARPVAQVVAWWERQANAMKRGVLMKRPGYHALNVWNDSLQMLGAGMNNPVKYAIRADGLIRAANAGDKRALALLGEAQKEGIAVDALQRADYAGTGLDAARTGKELRRQAEGKSAQAWYTKLDETVDAFASRWESTSKLAMYLWAREKGMPSWAAAKTAFDNLIDYSDRGRVLQIARWFTPFITWAAKMPKIAATQIAQRPARIANISRAINQIAGNEYNEPRSYLKDREMMKALPSPLARLYGAGREAVGGDPLSPGETTNFAPSLPYEEGFQLPKAALGALGAPFSDKPVRDSLRPLAGQLGPGWKAGFESFTGTDVTTGQPVDLKPAGIVPAQVAPPWVPDALVTTGQEEHGLIPRHFANYLPGFRALGPGAVLGTNVLMREFAGKPDGPQPPVSYFGVNRPFAYDSNPRNTYYNQLLNFITGAGFFSTLPEGATWSAAHAPETQSAIKKAQFNKKLGAEGRKNR